MEHEVFVMSDEITIPPERLIDAVDAVFEALDELGAVRFSRRPSELMGSTEQPRAFCDFTPLEIRAAERFLHRCGMLESLTHGNETRH